MSLLHTLQFRTDGLSTARVPGRDPQSDSVRNAQTPMRAAAEMCSGRSGDRNLTSPIRSLSTGFCAGDPCWDYAHDDAPLDTTRGLGASCARYIHLHVGTGTNDRLRCCASSLSHSHH